MEYRVLGSTGLKVSVLSLGAASLGGVYSEIDEKEGIRTVHEAIDAGINLIDVSPFYGYTRAETVLGQALADVPRDRYLLASKAGRYGEAAFDFSPDRILRSVDESLARLKTDYLDILQLHDIEFVPLGPIVEQAIPVLQKLKEQGKIRYYGITGLPLKIFTEISGKVHLDTILSYCRCTLIDTALLDLLPLLQGRGIGVMNASPLSMGLLTHRGAPDWHPAPAEIQEACRRAAEFCASNGGDLSKLAFQYALAQPGIATTLVGTANPEHLKRNVQWLVEPIDTELLGQVQQILRPIHNLTWQRGLPENN